MFRIEPSIYGSVVKSNRPYSREYCMGTLMVTNARLRIENDEPVVVADNLIHESVEDLEPSSSLMKMLYEYDESMGELTAAGAYIVGGIIYLYKENT